MASVNDLPDKEEKGKENKESDDNSPVSEEVEEVDMSVDYIFPSYFVCITWGPFVPPKYR